MGSEKHRGSVGATYVEVRVSARVGGRSKPLSLLVDTGSDYCIMPRRVLHALGIKPEERQRFELANGRTIRRDVGIAYLSFRGRVTATNVIFGGSRDGPVLGVIALEQFGYQVDPVRQRLRRTKRLLPSVRAA